MADDSTATQPTNEAPTRKMPIMRAGFRPLRMYNAIWRAFPGDSIFGAVIAQQPVELPDGKEAHCVMLQLLEPTPCFVFDALTPFHVEIIKPVATVTAESFAIVAVRVDQSAALARLLTVADQEPGVQVVQIDAVDTEDGSIRYFTQTGIETTERIKVDPMAIAALMHAQRLAREAAGHA